MNWFTTGTNRMSYIPLRAVQTFEAVARYNSLKLAAEELAVTPSAISHQVRYLERHLGIALFHRFNRRVVLTDAGRIFYDQISGAFGQIDHAAKLVSERRFTDLLTVHCCPPSFAPSWLLPRVKSFIDSYPSIELRVHATPEPADFAHDKADLEIRYGDGHWPWLHVRPLMSEIVTPLCAPGLLPKRAEPLGIDELRGLPLIHSERNVVTWAAWFAANGSEPGDLVRGLRFDHGILAIDAAVQGLGVALENTVLAYRDLKRGDLVTPFVNRAAHVSAGRHYLVCPQENLKKPKVRSFYDWLMDEIK